MPYKKYEVEIIAQDGQTALIQWYDDGDHHRAYIPADEIKDGKAASNVLRAGIPYGAPWEELIGDMLAVVELSARAFAAALHGRNIWTAGDIERDPRAARRAIEVALGIHVGDLLREARKLERRVGG